MNGFEKHLEHAGIHLDRRPVEIVQVNTGKLCNMTCSHCHVEAGPAKIEENMDRETAEAVIRFLKNSGARTLDITGGAPEMNPNFKYLVKEARALNVKVIDRCNLTVFFEKGYEGLPRFLADHQVEIVASLPCYTRGNVDEQRGRGAFHGSIEALRLLNSLGYGIPGRGLELHLVYNPVGPHLPPPQKKLELDYKERLSEDLGIVFNRLFTITNMPITRYEGFLKAKGDYEKYIALLRENFNGGTIKGLMCRDTVSIGWNGDLYDCDFNQAIDLPMKGEKKRSVFNTNPDDILPLPIATGEHCFGCTAGSGSSCQGAIR